MEPALVLDDQETDPAGVVGEEGVTLEDLGEDLGEMGSSGLLVHLLETGSLPGAGTTFDDERTLLLVELVGVGCKQAVVVLAEGERQSVKELRRSQPDVAVAPFL